MPLRLAASQRQDLLQLDWPHDWYQGRNAWTRAVKRVMYRDGLRRLRRIPVVWTAHNLPCARRAGRGLRAPHDPGADRRLRRHHRAVARLGVLLRDAYDVAPATRVEVIHHGHYIGCYPNEITREEARRRLGCRKPGASCSRSAGCSRTRASRNCSPPSPRSRTGDVLLLAGQTVSDDYAAR